MNGSKGNGSRCSAGGGGGGKVRAELNSEFLAACVAGLASNRLTEHRKKLLSRELILMIVTTVPIDDMI